MTYILAIDTTLGACSVAILKNDQVIDHKQETRARGHVERLLPMIDDMCKAQDFLLKELDYIAVTVGPGTFAGVRIGLSAAKGMGLALHTPIIPITTLEVFLFQFLERNHAYSGTVVVMIDARRGEIYRQYFQIENGVIKKEKKPEAIKISDAVKDLKNKKAKLIGSGCSLIEEHYPHRLLSFEKGYEVPDIVTLGKTAYGHIERARACDDVLPLYLRAPDAKLPSQEKMIISDD